MLLERLRVFTRAQSQVRSVIHVYVHVVYSSITNTRTVGDNRGDVGMRLRNAFGDAHSMLAMARYECNTTKQLYRTRVLE